jgi:hypothetical protein
MHVRLIKMLSRASIAALCVGLLVSVTVVTARDPDVDYKVFVAFGFHVNLYHSFRNDTNDEYGFGKDIRVIRHIIKTLDSYNDQGVPVRGVWDFDNLFSLQERLPQYAPDIILDIQRRVNGRGDEVILMSYNNGLASAMTHRELTDAVRWAVSNPWGSGVRDLFGRYSPIVRPQEMMTTPGNFSIYKAQGIQAVSLYYSATPFDAFRVFSRPLSRTEAFNPITYRHPRTREEMTVIPTYHIGDLMEHVSLGNWAAKLHRLQQKGEIDHDVLIYINYDADSEFWSGLNLRWPLDRLPNTGGLADLIEEVKDLDYLEFTTLDDYLRSHPPLGTFSFGQDTADGSFDGYNSWAEKAQTHKYWTRIEYHRRFERMVDRALKMIGDSALDEKIRTMLTPLYLKRMRALSTTNFGMATPYLAPGREAAMAALLDAMDDDARRIEGLLRSAIRERFDTVLYPDHLPGGVQWLDTVMLSGLDLETAGENGYFLSVDLSIKDIENRRLSLMAPDGQVWPATVVQQSTSGGETGTRIKLYLSRSKFLEDGIYYLLSAPFDQRAPRQSIATGHRLTNDKVELKFTPDGKVSGLFVNGIAKLAPGSLTPYFRHHGMVAQPEQLQVVPFSPANGAASVRMSGHWKGPQDGARPGRVDYQFSLLDGLPYLFVHGRITYPSTVENDVFKADAPALARRTDWGWQEAAPMELRFAPRSDINQPVRILKHNFLGLSSSYPLDYFQHSKENLSLDNINNHITAAYFGIVAGGHGMTVAMDTHVAANFAFAPVKVHYDEATDAFSVKANPFGTYHGRQYRRPTWGNGQGYEMAMIAGEQFHSAGPTYNGQTLSFAAMLAFFDEEDIPTQVKQDLVRYARSPEVFSLTRESAPRPDRRQKDNLLIRSEETALTMPRDRRPLPPQRLSLNFKLKVLWANISAYISRYAL